MTLHRLEAQLPWCFVMRAATCFRFVRARPQFSVCAREECRVRSQWSVSNSGLGVVALPYSPELWWK